MRTAHRYEKFMNEKNPEQVFVAVPVEFFFALQEISKEWSLLMSTFGRDIHGLPQVPSSCRYGGECAGEVCAYLKNGKCVQLEEKVKLPWHTEES